MMLRGENVHLRALEPEDLEIFMEVENDTRLWDCSTTNVPYSRFSIRNFISSATYDIYADKQVRLVACENSSGVPVAFADIVDFDPRHMRAEVGIVVFPGQRGKGIGLETVELLGEYAARHLRMHVLYAIAAAGNEASARLFRRAGYVQAAVLPQWFAKDGGYCDALLFERILN